MSDSSTTRESAAIRVLLVSFEKASVEMLTDIMGQMGILVDVCADRKTAVRHLCNSKYEGLIVDLVLGQDALDLLSNLPDFTSNRSAVSCAILNEAHEKASAFQAGANFALDRPLESATAARTLRAAYPMMVRERRRYFRCPVQTPTFVACVPHPEFQATSVNISEAGMAILSPVPLKVGQSLKIRMRIPGNADFIDVAGEVCWTADGSSRAGVQFLEISTSVAESLASWLLGRLEEMIPQTTGLTPQITQVGLNRGSGLKLFRGN
jgi:CheY-like chemotaxis protein